MGRAWLTSSKPVTSTYVYVCSDYEYVCAWLELAHSTSLSVGRPNGNAQTADGAASLYASMLLVEHVTHTHECVIVCEC